MKKNTSGHNGPIVSNLGLGTMTFGVETSRSEAFAQMDLYLDQGGNFIDTADVYAGGMSETIIGKWLKERNPGDDMIIATKGRFAPPSGSHGASRRGIVLSIEASLKRLQLDRIDIYHLHGWDIQTDIEETLDVLVDLVRMGKIHHFAWSNISAWQLQKILQICECRLYPKPVAIQLQYSLLERGIEYELLPCCMDSGASITAWSPLGGGWLTGKYVAETMPHGATRLGEDPNRGVEAYALRNNDRTYAILGVLQDIATRMNLKPEHVALAWLLDRPTISSALLGARTSAQLADNLRATTLELDPEDHDRLTEVSAGWLGYPYDFLGSWSNLSHWHTLGTGQTASQ